MRLAGRIAPLVLFALVVPVMGHAQPILEGPRAETLVEGHTVFLSIDAYQFAPGEFEAAASERMSALVASEEPIDRVVATRFPGVLWFNDQYVVPPSQTVRVGGLGGGQFSRTDFAASLAVLVRADDGARVREPCGGAVLAVNSGDPDPRHLLVDPTMAAPAFVYVESYRVADPNSHVFVVDRYLATTSIDGFAYSYPVWVSNLLGSPVFVPDEGEAIVSAGEPPGGHCTFGKDLESELAAPVVENTCMLSVDDGAPLATTSNPDQDLDLLQGGLPSWVDDPCMGYMEPSYSGFCYNGREGKDRDLDGDLDHDDCLDATYYRARRYHALLYFGWEDLTQAGASRDHSDLFRPSPNGCQSGTEWPCPGEATWQVVYGADDEEGNSHTSHPRAPAHEVSEACIPEFAGPNPTNHGGSTQGQRGVCDYVHATAQVDVYFSGTARPLDPATRTFVVDDAAGSSDPFADFRTAYAGAFP